jgi:uncharacterized protein YukE
MTESQPSRAAFLAERVEAAQGRPTFQVPFRQRQQDLVKIDVPIGFPLYNLRSGRTHRAQAQYVERHDLPADFFSDPESPESQAAQHEILLELINEADLAEDLASKKQQNPLVLTYDGFVVDGNRRTAALRDEGETENLIAVVLPKDATASEVYETELELQMARQTKAKYNWIDEALHVYWGVHDLGEPIHAIAQRMNQKDKEIEEMLGRLTLVDLYLEWLGAPTKYHRVSADGSGAAEQSFIELYQRESRAQHRNLPELQRRAIRHACFSAIEQGGGYMDVRRIADSVRTRPAEVVRRVREALPEDLRARLEQPVETPATTSTGNLLLDQLAEADEDDATPAGAELLNVVDEPADAPVVAPIIMQVAEDLADEARETAQQLDALRKVERALRSLNDVEIDEQTQSTEEIARALGQVIERAEQLAVDLEALRSSEA